MKLFEMFGTRGAPQLITETEYKVFNHNDTFLGGPYKTEAEADAEATEYMTQTGNAAYVLPVNDTASDHHTKGSK